MTRNLTPILKKHFLESKIRVLNPREAVTVPSGTTLNLVVRLLVEQNIGSVLVSDSPGQVQGIVTERDILIKTSARERKLEEILVEEVMSTGPESLPAHASIARALYTMSVGHFRHVPIVNVEEKKCFVISIKDLVEFLFERIAKKIVATIDENIVDPSATAQFFAETVDILEPHPAQTVDEKLRVQDAVAILREEKMGSVLVMSHGKKLVGIFTERDYLRKVALGLLPVWRGAVSQVMTTQPETVLSTATCSMAFEKMASGGFRHLPVMNEMERVVGVISARNIVDFLAKSVLGELGG